MSIYKKLFDAKKEIGKISKDSKNPFFKSKYFDINSLLEHVEPILQKQELLILQPINDGFVSTQIIDIESGELITSALELKNLTDPQKRGSEITYYRRYTLTSLLGLQAEDDDGNIASKPIPKNIVWLTDEQFENALSSDEKGLKATLRVYNTDSKKMKPEQKQKLEDLLNFKQSGASIVDTY